MDADGERPPQRDGLAALFDDNAALEFSAVDHGVRLAFPVRPGGVGEADQPLELAAVEFGLAVGRQQGGIDIGNADHRGDGVDLAAVEDDLRVALAFDDHNAVFGKTVIDADPPAVEREASGLGVDQHLLAAARIGIGVDVELAAAAAVLDRQIARDADGSRERRGSAEKGHGISGEIQRDLAGLNNGPGISRAAVQLGRFDVGAELHIGNAGAQRRAKLVIGRDDHRVARVRAASRCADGGAGCREQRCQQNRCQQQREQFSSDFFHRFLLVVERRPAHTARSDCLGCLRPAQSGADGCNRPIGRDTASDFLPKEREAASRPLGKGACRTASPSNAGFLRPWR